jgi:hypothetical protein
MACHLVQRTALVEKHQCPSPPILQQLGRASESHRSLRARIIPFFMQSTLNTSWTPSDYYRGSRLPRYGPPNTRDQLRGAHDLALVHDERADHDAPIRLQPPLVSCIALFGGSLVTPNGRSS